MKKITFLIMFVVMSISLTLPVFATDVGEPTSTESTPIEETLTESELEPPVDVPSEEVVLPDSMTGEDIEGYWNEFKETIANFSVWMTGIFGVSGVAAMGFIAKWAFTKIFDKLAENASKTESKMDDKFVENREAIESAVAKKIDTFATELIRLEKNTQTSLENQDKMYALMTLFFTNVKMPESAKAEILEIASGIKKYEGNLEEMLAEAQKSIDTRHEEQKALAEPTPELDKLVEETTYMKLG
jgi:hypothetical protein